MIYLTRMLPEDRHHSRAHSLMPRVMQEGRDGTDTQTWVLGEALTNLSLPRGGRDKLPQENPQSIESSQGPSRQLSLHWQPQAPPRGNHRVASASGKEPASTSPAAETRSV